MITPFIHAFNMLYVNSFKDIYKLLYTHLKCFNMRDNISQKIMYVIYNVSSVV